MEQHKCDWSGVVCRGGKLPLQGYNTVLLFLALASIVFIFVWSTSTSLSSHGYETNKEMKKTSFEPSSIIRRPSSSGSCSCKAKTFNVTSAIEASKLSAIKKRRAEEYRKQLIRETTDLDVVLVNPSNSPLQYPSHGFTVEPLKMTFIPGLGVNAYGREVYKVSLCASHGVIAVDSAPHGQVMAQNQSIHIIATSVDDLNDLLAHVTYTSVVYLLKAGDLVHFTFEDHEAIFPVTIKKPTLPVLYDLGEDINSQVTIAVKTFLRYAELRYLIKTIRERYPDIRIIIADDSLTTEKVEGHNIYQYIMPPAQGWFAGRNLAISQVTTKYFLWVDDDFEFLKETSIEKFVEIMESVPELDVLGGSVDTNRFYFTLEQEEGADGEGGCLSRLHKYHKQLPGFENCVLVDGVVNFFLARTDSARRVGFDPKLNRVGHSEFFMDGLGRLLVASCSGLVVGHQPMHALSKYQKFRHPGKGDENMKLKLHYFKNHLKCVTF
ncbi:beta-1,4 N-acetylgalactosaminyltransferase 1-like [Sardina pilchardus]|uniref:beta-1,4 N-acetylgalactosaminyltransferase 1-like n=1 Tax=Sardina pilchardus TaxID=27697 RepID=UPI002E15B8A3